MVDRVMSRLDSSEKAIQVPMNLLISARSLAEAQMVIDSGAKWLDIKEPSRGSLGRPDPELVDALAQLDIPESIHVSIAGGELVDWATEKPQAFMAKLPPHFYLKIALANCQDTSWKEAVRRISDSLVSSFQLILVHYADASSANSPEWAEIIETAHSLGSRYVLIDTYQKTGGGLLDHYRIDQLRGMIRVAESLRIGVALAGSLQLSQLTSLANVGAQWLGVRGAVCEGVDRTGKLSSERLHQALSILSIHSPNEL